MTPVSAAPNALPFPAAPDRALGDLLEHFRTHFYGLYRCVVTENEDPAKRGQIKVRGGVFGQAESAWCKPCVPYAGPQVGVAFLPEKGSGVWVAFEGGDISLPVWVGCYWRENELPAEASPDVKVIVTKSKLEVKLDDHAQSITITDSNGNTVTLDKSGITLNNGTQQVVVNDASVSVNDGALQVS